MADEKKEVPRSKEEIINRALKALNVGTNHYSELAPIDYREVLQKAGQIGATQTRIKNLLLSEKGTSVQRFWAKAKLLMNKGDHDLERLMSNQYDAISLVKAGLEDIRRGVTIAKEFSQAYWEALIDIPMKVADKEDELLNETVELTDKKQNLGFEGYDKDERTKEYYQAFKQKREIERKLKVTLSEQSRLVTFSRQVDLQAMRIDDILEYLTDVESFATDWHLKVSLAQSDLFFLKEILPVVSTDADVLREVIELSNNIIANTKELTTHELGKKYASLHRIGLAPYAILSNPRTYESLEQLLPQV